MRHMPGAAPHAAATPEIDDVKHQRRVNGDHRVEALGRLPGPEPHSGHIFPRHAGGKQWHAPAVAGDHMSRLHQPRHQHHNPLQRTVHQPRGGPAARLLAQHMPRLKRPPQLESHAVVHHLPQLRKAELPQGLKPVALEGKSTPPQIVEHAVKICHQEMGQEKLVVQRRSPAHQRAVPGTLPHCCHQRPHNELREQADPHMRGHLKGAQFHQPPLAAGSVGGKELVDAEFCPVGVAGQIDQQVAEHPIDKPRGTLRPRGPQFLQRDLQFVEAFMTGLVDAGRLAGGTDERAGKEI